MTMDTYIIFSYTKYHFYRKILNKIRELHLSLHYK
jgi:hypothetical protein